MRSRHEWQAMLRSLGAAFTDLVSAETAMVGGEIKRSGRHLLVAVSLFTLAFTVVLWATGVATAFLVALFGLWMPVWAACLVVVGLLLVVVVVLGALAMARLRRLEGPIALISRRWQDHWTWWREQVLAEEPTVRVSGRREEEP
jgi:Flp pilus assembly protein TadB